MNYWVRLAKGPTSTSDIFFENTLQDWDRLRALLSYGYVIVQVEPEHA
jgi:hypothetical protein